MQKPIRQSTIILFMAFLAVVASAVAAIEPELSDGERTELIELLEESRQQFEELTALSSGDTWSQSPAEGKWSVGEVAEHLVLAEEGIMAMAQGALDDDMDPEWESVAGTTVEQLVATLGDRSQKFQAPEPFQPKNEMSRVELLDKFAQLRARTLDFVRTTDAPLKAHTAQGPPGKMNAHQWIALIGAHNLRHNAQIAEAQEMVAAQADMPATR